MRAFELRYRLRALMQKYDAAPEQRVVPPVDPIPYPVRVGGVVTTTDQDLDRMQLVPYAFGFPLPGRARDVPLLLRHDPNVVAGEVEDLEYANGGTLLRVRARIENAEARRLSAFSPTLQILECELRDSDNERFVGVLQRVELVEISVTDRPANPKAVIEYRNPAAIGDFHSHMIKKVECVGRLVELMKEMNHGRQARA